MSVTFNGQTRAEGWRHIDHDGNPHAHVILIDVDGNGERVGHFSRSASFRRQHSPVKGNVKHWLRQVWQDDCNAVLEANGYDFRIDRRSNLDQALAKQQAERLGCYEMVDEEIPTGAIEPEIAEEPQVSASEPTGDECPLVPVDAPQTDEYPDASETSEDEMVETPAAQRVQHAADLFRQLKFLKHTQNKVHYLSQQVERTRLAMQKAELEGSGYALDKMNAEMQLDMAREKLSQYQKANGKLRGFDLKIWKSPTRKQAEKAQAEYASLETQLSLAQRDYETASGRVEHYTNLLETQHQQKASAEEDLKRIAATIGDDKDLSEAEDYLTENMHQALDGLSPAKLLEMMQDGYLLEGDYADALRIINTPEAKEYLYELENDAEQSKGT